MRKIILVLVALVVIILIISLYAYYMLLLECNTLAYKYRLLEEKYERLSLEHADLTSKYRKLETNYTDLKAKYSVLKSHYTELKNKFSNLNERFLSLVKRHRELETKYTRIEQIIEVRTLFGGEEVIKAIISAVDPSSVEHVIEELGIDVHMSDRSKVKAVMNWLMLNTMYMPDPCIPVSVGDGIYWRDDYITLPNETLARGGGDCEDLALLAYALFQNVFGAERVWIIAWRNDSSAHWAVLLEGEGGWCIVDPAGRYVTGVEKISLRLSMLDTRGREYTVWISPIHLRCDLKLWLISKNFAQLEYRGRVEFSSLEEVVRAWLKYWDGGWIYMVANVEKVRFFDSTEEFLGFMGG